MKIYLRYCRFYLFIVLIALLLASCKCYEERDFQFTPQELLHFANYKPGDTIYFESNQHNVSVMTIVGFDTEINYDCGKIMAKPPVNGRWVKIKHLPYDKWHGLSSSDKKTEIKNQELFWISKDPINKTVKYSVSFKDFYSDRDSVPGTFYPGRLTLNGFSFSNYYVIEHEYPERLNGPENVKSLIWTDKYGLTAYMNNNGEIWTLRAELGNRNAATNTKNQSPETSGQTGDTGTYFYKKPKEYYYRYDSTIERIDNFDRGYADTFSISGSKFRVVSNPDKENDIEIQVLNKGEWTGNFKSPYGYGFETTRDFNLDGYEDGILCMLRGCSVYLYDKTSRRFCPEAVSVGLEYTLIDTARHIYAAEMARDYWVTWTFKLNGLRSIELYSADIEITNEKKDTGKITVRKTDASGTEAVVEVKTIHNITESFEYDKYWLEFLKKRNYR